MLSSKKITFISLSLVLSFAFGIIASPYLLDPEIISNTKEIRKNFNYKFISPLLECEGSNISQDPNLTSLKKAIEYLIDQEKENNKISLASVYYRDLNNGPWISINATEYFSPASLIKVPVMIAYYKEAESDPSIMQKKVLYTKPFDYSQQNITPTQKLEIDKEYTIDELINRMIIYSDNAAYELLLSNIDNIKVFQVYTDLDVDISKAQNDPNGNIITVKDYASFFRILFNASYLNQKMSEKALELLSQSQYQDGLVAGVPDNIVIAHKFGERQFLPSREKQLHDCGIVYLPNKPYLLCVMSRGGSFKQITNFVKQVSTTVYTEVSKTNI